MPALKSYIDAAILQPNLTQQSVQTALARCLEMEIFSVCVRPCDLVMARQLCSGRATQIGTVLGFPHGLQLSATKLAESQQLIALGAQELDMVANYAWALSGEWAAVESEIQEIAATTRTANVILKVIIETAQLDTEHLQKFVEICHRAGADYVKTSTGFNGAGAQYEEVRKLVEFAAGAIKIKASGGIRDQASAQKFIELGVSRLGISWSTCAAILDPSSDIQTENKAY
jgi:deoxyribose-phosphate aldolase